MAGNLTTYGANAILDGTAMPATLYVKLHLGNPGVNAIANAATETTRQSFTRDAASGGATQNAAQIQWLNYPASETITHISLWDAASSGNPWWVAARAGGGIAVTAAQTVSIDDTDLDLAFTLWS